MSPTILRTKNYRVVIYPRDHNPPHVHVIGPGAEAKFTLDDLECVYSRGFSPKALSWLEKYLAEKKKQLMEVWDEYQT